MYKNNYKSEYYDSIANFIIDNKLFELTNHLGNVLATVSDRKLAVDSNNDGVVDYYTANVVTANDYYPYGMQINDRQFSLNNSQFRYGFNNKEKDNDIEIGAQDYGMRIYDERTARFLSVDPITKKYPELTPYQFASNRPIEGVDIDGKEFGEGIAGAFWGVEALISYFTAATVTTATVVAVNNIHKTASDENTFYWPGSYKPAPAPVYNAGTGTPNDFSQIDNSTGKDPLQPEPSGGGGGPNGTIVTAAVAAGFAIVIAENIYKTGHGQGNEQQADNPPTQKSKVNTPAKNSVGSGAVGPSKTTPTETTPTSTDEWWNAGLTNKTTPTKTAPTTTPQTNNVNTDKKKKSTPTLPKPKNKKSPTLPKSKKQPKTNHKNED